MDWWSYRRWCLYSALTYFIQAQRHVWRCIEVTYLRHFMLSLLHQKSWVNSHKGYNFIEQHKTSSIWFLSFSWLLPDPSVLKFSIEKEATACFLEKASSHPLYFKHTSHSFLSLWVNRCGHSSNLPISTQNLSVVQTNLVGSYYH